MRNNESIPSPYTDAELARLEFRRQFLMGPAPLEGPSDWKRFSIGTGIRLFTHPDLEATQVERGGKSITLIGYLLDPSKPDASSADILRGLLDRLQTCDEFFALTNDLGGRWALVVLDGERSILFGDAAGQRQVCYSPGSPKTFCATQPSLLARELGLSMDPDALAYMASRGEEDTDVYWMPGDTTLYKEIRSLLPNHCLDLDTGRVHRFWPRLDIERSDLDSAVRQSQQMMRGLLESARRRYPLALSMTAGWDSRLMLALCKEAIRDIYCFTLSYPHLSEHSRDVVVPKKLLGKLGIPHEVLRFPAAIEPRFKAIYKGNNASANGAYSADAQAMYEHYPGARVCVTGDIAEVVKCYYRPKKTEPSGVSAELLADLCKLGRHPFVIKALGEWLAGAHSRNIDVLDLFCWEQMAGRWQALVRSEYDMVQESFSPFNCRTVLTTLLSVDEQFREPPKYGVMKSLIANLWSEVLAVPINPKEKVRFKRLVVRMFRNIGIYEMVPHSIRNVGKRLLS